ncbi:MAG TPA: hypothetical protein VHY79_04240 [Rhizomicrobium sp.]|jgi:hypothetical protein|nr:hypothetical protein [Rhizomicrobium sp.]
MLNRQREFRAAADVVAAAWMEFPEVEAIAVIGSVAECEISRLRRRRINRRLPDFSPRNDLLAPAEHAMLYKRGCGRLRSALDLPATDVE